MFLPIILFSVASLTLNCLSSYEITLEEGLFRILPVRDQIEIYNQKKHSGQIKVKRSLDDAFLDFPAGIVPNVSNAEKEFFRLPMEEFHDRIYNQFARMQKKVWNDSMTGMQHDMKKLNQTDLNENDVVHHVYEKKPGGYVRDEKTYKIPTKDGVKIVKKGLKKYKDNMENWVEQTFVHKPRNIIDEEKSKLHQFKSNATSDGKQNRSSIPYEQLARFWGFENEFDNMMRKYQRDMNEKLFDQYDRLFDHFIEDDQSDHAALDNLNDFMFSHPNKHNCSAHPTEPPHPHGCCIHGTPKV